MLDNRDDTTIGENEDDSVLVWDEKIRRRYEYTYF